jgi:hypothetical protein
VGDPWSLAGANLRDGRCFKWQGLNVEVCRWDAHDKLDDWISLLLGPVMETARIETQLDEFLSPDNSYSVLWLVPEHDREYQTFLSCLGLPPITVSVIRA